MTHRGHTLSELMVSLALITALSSIAAVLVSSARRDDRVAQGYADDLRHLRRASDLLAQEIRSSLHVELSDGALVTDGVRWTVADGALCRDGTSVVAGVARLELSSSDPCVWTVGIVPAPRRAGAAAPALTTTVRRRVEASR